MYEFGQVHDDLEGACRTFLAIINAGLRPSIISYNTLVGALAKNPNSTVILPSQAQPLEPQQRAPRLPVGCWSMSNFVLSLNGSTGLDASFQGELYPTTSETLLSLTTSLVGAPSLCSFSGYHVMQFFGTCAARTAVLSVQMHGPTPSSWLR